MKKARLPDGQLVLAHQYNKEAHGGGLLCADPDCGARMTYRREALTHGSSALRSASFVSKAVSDHISACTAHEDFAVLARRKKSIEEGLREGKTIVLNLNMRLSEEFNSAALPQDVIGLASTHEKSNYVTAPVKSVEDLLALKAAIEEKGGAAGLVKTVVNYKGKTLPLEDFVIDSRKKYGDLLDKMYAAVDKARPGTSVEDFPRLIAFRATQNTQRNETGAIRGTPMTFARGPGNKLILLQLASVPKEFEKTLRGENVFIIAAPSLGANEARAVLHRLKTPQQKPVFLNLRWNVVGAHQFTPIEEAPAAQPQVKTRPNPPAQGGGQQGTLFGM